MQTAVLLAVPEAEPLVASWRATGDPAAALGIPAHVTLLYPFLPPDRVDDGVVDALAWFFRGVDAFQVRFDRVEEFAASGVVYLDPDGKELDELAGALARRWPETPPYGGAVEQPYAHLTVVHSAARTGAGASARSSRSPTGRRTLGCAAARLDRDAARRLSSARSVSRAAASAPSLPWARRS